MQDSDIKSLLTTTRTIALIGASPKPFRDANRIMHFLIDEGYKVYPVNPNYSDIDGIQCYPTVKSIPDAIDMVDVFRNPDEIMPVIDDAIASHAKSVWLQLGVINEAAKKKAESAGLIVVMDLCILIEHRRLIKWAK